MRKSQWRYKKPRRIQKRFSVLYSLLRNKIFWFAAPFLFVIGCAFYFFIFSHFFQIRKIEILGLQKISNEEFKNFIERNIAKKVWVFPAENIFLADFGKTAKEMLNIFPQLDEIKIKRDLPSTVIVNVEEKKSVAILSSQEKNFFLDKKGIIFEESGGSPSEFPVIILDGLEKDLKLGEKIINADRLSKILEIDSKLKSDFHLQVEVFQIISDDKLIVKTKEGWEFYLNLEGDVNWQLAKLSAVLEEKIPQEKRSDLEYIELRFGNFAPYKYR